MKTAFCFQNGALYCILYIGRMLCSHMVESRMAKRVRSLCQADLILIMRMSPHGCSPFFKKLFEKQRERESDKTPPQCFITDMIETVSQSRSPTWVTRSQTLKPFTAVSTVYICRKFESGAWAWSCAGTQIWASFLASQPLGQIPSLLLISQRTCRLVLSHWWHLDFEGDTFIP